MSKLTQNKVKMMLEYDPTTGIFTWKTDRQKYKVGQRAGYFLESTNQMHIQINRVRYRLSHVAWLYLFGYVPNQMYYKDGDGTNLKFENLATGIRPKNGTEKVDIKCPICNKLRNVPKATVKVSLPDEGLAQVICQTCARVKRHSEMERPIQIQIGSCLIQKSRRRKCEESEITCEHFNECLTAAAKGNWGGWERVEV